jgi:hypothetical protein
MMVVGKIRLVEEVPGGNGVVCVFATARGGQLGVVKPKVRKVTKDALIDVPWEMSEES